MSWLQLELVTGKSEADTLTELLEQMGAVSVTLSANSDEPVFDQHGEANQLWQNTRIQALLHPDTDLDILLVCIKNRVGAEKLTQHKIKMIKDKDWVSEYKSHHQPVLFADRIWISPSWCEMPESEKPTITLDPGLAFGTGSHPTTALCIQWLAENDIKDKTVIDYGCGSGILAMAAAKLGARHVYAVDIDPQAVNAASENVSTNKLENTIRVGLVDQMELPIADVLLANILMNPLIGLIMTFSSLTHANSQLVLSGLLHTQAEECQSAYSAYFSMQTAVYKDEWARLEGCRL
ncbi:MAG: 50S ribosomal protein L11 methyltransferase [Pseudomonadota bacterium]